MSLIEDFRTIMLKEKINYYIIPTSDYHNSEYISPFFKSREYLSKFTGSAGTLLITSSSAYLWVDGRYYLQAEKQIDSKEINIMKDGTPNTLSLLDFLKSKVDKDETIGFDGRLFTYNFVNKLKNNFDFEIKIKTDLDILDELWTSRPKLPFSSIYVLDNVYCGEGYQSKLERLNTSNDEQL